MFKRFFRVLKSWFGKLIDTASDPKLILEQNIRELNDQIPKMNASISTVKANKMMLEKEVKRLKKSVSELTNKIRSAIQSDRDDIAENYALKLENTKQRLSETENQLDYADRAYKKSMEVKEAFMREKDKKIKMAKEALRAHERSEWQGKIADTMEQFEVGGIESTHEEMIKDINEQTAKNEARMEMALDSIDTEEMEIEKNAESLRAKELVNQFKTEMDKTNITIDDAVETKNDKTIGNKQAVS